MDALAKDFDGAGPTVTDAKTKAGDRWVPMTAKALVILKRRAQGKAGSEPLWPEYPPAALDGRRSHAASKRWLRWKRQAVAATQVDFHSLRRYWITKAEECGIDAVTMARLVGHSMPVWTLATYSRGQKKDKLVKAAKKVAALIDKSLSQQSS